LIAEKDAKNRHPAANAKNKYKAHQKIDQDVGLVGFAGLAVIFRVAILAFDLREQPGTQRAAPPGEVDLLGVALSAFGARRVLHWVLHVIPPVNDL
jgi:hypothetical protein